MLNNSKINRNNNYTVNESEPEPKQTSYLASLFKSTTDEIEAEVERDKRFGYTPRNTNKSGSFTI